MEKNISSLQAEQAQMPLAVNPKKFIVWLFIVSIVMMFAGWTSTFLVAVSEGVGTLVELPSIFTASTVLLVMSSVSMHLAYRAGKKDQLGQVKFFTGLTFTLGIVFLLMQWQGFGALVSQDVFMVGGSAIDSFYYVLPFMHGVHILAGLIFLLVILFKTFKFQVHSKNMLSMEMCSTFWHFLDGLWLYLFFFLQFN